MTSMFAFPRCLGSGHPGALARMGGLPLGLPRDVKPQLKAA